MCAHLVKRVHEILKSHTQYSPCPQSDKSRRTGRSSFDKTACSYIYLLFFHVIMDRDSIIKFYFSLGMHYGDILSTLASQGIVISQSTLTRTSLVLSTLCTVFFSISCACFTILFARLLNCTRLSKTQIRNFISRGVSWESHLYWRDTICSEKTKSRKAPGTEGNSSLVESSRSIKSHHFPVGRK